MTGTRQRILDVALELFAERGYAGTSVADITKRLGISKAALYHHFTAKGEILEALLGEPLAGYAELVRTAADRPAGELLAAIVDRTAELATVSHLLGDDPSVGRALRERELPRAGAVNEALTSALAGGDPAAMVRAHAAYGAIKNGTLALMTATGAPPTPAQRDELVAAARRALADGPV
jgi:AcrR family transcriptional regulator